MATTRDGIVESFAALYDRHGYQKTSVEAIAKDLRISKKTIYVHFQSKDEIFREMVRWQAEAERARISELLIGRETYRDKLDGLVGIVFEFVREWWEQHRGSERAERVAVGERVFLEAYTELIREYVREGVAAGEFTVDDVEMAARFVGGVILAGTRMIEEDPSHAPEPHVVLAVDRLLTC